MIRRNALQTLLDRASRHPTVTLTGPRQSGKTTLTREAFPEHGYVSLERPDLREEARVDPRGLLARFPEGLVLDEVQHVPELLSWIQVEVDEDPRPGRFILTGSQHFGLLQSVSQSLAGRTVFLHLLPPSWDELQRFASPPEGLFEALWVGAYPRIHDRRLPPQEWLASYVAAYVERDALQVLAIRDLRGFQTFIRLAAGRTAQVLNYSSLASDVGVSVDTVKSWISVLETSFIVTVLPAWHRNTRKRLVKAPKLHFLDSGLCCLLLGIGSPDELVTHSARGAIFESWVVAEIMKARLHRGLEARLHHLRTSRGEEIDLVLDTPEARYAVEAKSGATVVASMLKPMERLAPLVVSENTDLSRRLLYGGDEARSFKGVEIVPWRDLANRPWGA